MQPSNKFCNSNAAIFPGKIDLFFIYCCILILSFWSYKLTNKYLLLEVLEEKQSLKTISLIGMIISIAFTSLTFIIYILTWRYVKKMIYNFNIRIRRIVKIITNNLFALHIFFLFRSIRSDQNIIMLNLCGSLISSYAIFISVVEQTENEVHIVFSHCQGNVLYCFRLKQNFSYKNLTYSLFLKVKIWWTTIIMSTFRLCALRSRPFFTISSWWPSSVCWELASITSCVYQSRPTPCVWQTILDLSLESIGSW